MGEKTEAASGNLPKPMAGLEMEEAPKLSALGAAVCLFESPTFLQGHRSPGFPRLSYQTGAGRMRPQHQAFSTVPWAEAQAQLGRDLGKGPLPALALPGVPCGLAAGVKLHQSLRSRERPQNHFPVLVPGQGPGPENQRWV